MPFYRNVIRITYVTLKGFPGGSVVKNLSARLAGDTGLMPGLVRSPGEGNGNPPLKPQIMGEVECVVMPPLEKTAVLFQRKK